MEGPIERKQIVLTDVENCDAASVPEVPEAREDAVPQTEETKKAPVVKQDFQIAAPSHPRPSAPAKTLSNEAVTGHTANLWKYLPVPADKPEPMPEYLNGVKHFPGGRIIAARVRGKKHKHEGTNCDDWYEVDCFENIAFIAVADGAGSKRFSRIGARESCKASIGYLVRTTKQLFSERTDLRADLALAFTNQKCMEACGILAGVVQQSVIQAYEAVEAAFYSRSIDPAYEKELQRDLQFKDFSATLLVAVVIPVGGSTKESLVVTCQIGDGIIALFNAEGPFGNSFKLMGVPDSGDFSGETDFLTSPQMKAVEMLQSRTKISRGIADHVFVMSDGVADDYFPNETEMRRLYFDLLVNRILENKNMREEGRALTAAQMRLLKRIPDPLSYPWVNDPSRKISIQYTKRICESTKLTLEDIWNDPTVLSLARDELGDMENAEDPSERLKIWLDNYVERGSFDDRTLVIVEPCESTL